MGKPNFKELKKYQTQNIDNNILDLNNKIKTINEEIISLEYKKHPDYLKKIEGLIEQKNIEIEAQKKLLQELPNIDNPNKNQQTTKQQMLIADLNNKKKQLENTLQQKRTKRTEITTKIASLKHLKQKIEQQERNLSEFLENNLEEAQQYGLDIKEILKFKTDYSSIEKLIEDTENELNSINDCLGPVELEIESLSEQTIIKSKELTDEEKLFQNNELRKKEIEEEIKKLTGHPENTTGKTLSYYQKEKEFISNGLSNKIKTERNNRLDLSIKIFKNKNKIIELYNSLKESVDEQIKSSDLPEEYNINIHTSYNLDTNFYKDFLGYINKNRQGHFYGLDKSENEIKNIINDCGFSDINNVQNLLNKVIEKLEDEGRQIIDQVSQEKLNNFYNYLFSLDYLKPKYELKLEDKILSQLSPGERGTLLLVFYLMIDKEKIPLIIDQPEDNLDNESVYKMLSKFIKKAKKERQIIMVTHNPNLAVCADAEQIIYVKIDKEDRNKFSFESGSIENPNINKIIVKVLEGTKPAFDKRKLKYQQN